MAIELSSFSEQPEQPVRTSERISPTVAYTPGQKKWVEPSRHDVEQKAEDFLKGNLDVGKDQIAEKTHKLIGEASYYSDAFNGQKTATGERFSNAAMTAAHKTLPLGTWVRIESLNKVKGPYSSIDVRINDRGPYVPGRVIDLTSTAFKKIAPKGSTDVGAMKVKMTVLSMPKNA